MDDGLVQEKVLLFIQLQTMEKEMATHSSILAWRSPWTEEPGDLQSRDITECKPLSCSKKETTTLQWNLVQRKRFMLRLLQDDNILKF